MSDRRSEMEATSEQVRVMANPKDFDVLDTKSRLGILDHPDNEVKGELGVFLPAILHGLLVLEQEIDKKIGSPNVAGWVEPANPPIRSEEEFLRMQELVSSVARLLYLPHDAKPIQTESVEPAETENVDLVETESLEPKEAKIEDSGTAESVQAEVIKKSSKKRKPKVEKSWFEQRYGGSYSLETSIIEYTDEEDRPPKYIQARDYNFQIPATMRVEVIDRYNSQRLLFEFFPSRHAVYDGFPELYGTTAEDARLKMSHQKINHDRINEVIAAAEATAVNPHMTIRSERANGEPLSRLDGDLETRRIGQREVQGVNFHMTSVGNEHKPINPFVTAMEQGRSFVPLPSLKNASKAGNVPLGALGTAFFGLKFKPQYEFKPAVAAPAGRRTA